MSKKHEKCQKTRNVKIDDFSRFFSFFLQQGAVTTSKLPIKPSWEKIEAFDKGATPPFLGFFALFAHSGGGFCTPGGGGGYPGGWGASGPWSEVDDDLCTDAVETDPADLS